MDTEHAVHTKGVGNDSPNLNTNGLKSHGSSLKTLSSIIRRKRKTTQENMDKRMKTTQESSRWHNRSVPLYQNNENTESEAEMESDSLKEEDNTQKKRKE